MRVETDGGPLDPILLSDFLRHLTATYAALYTLQRSNGLIDVENLSPHGAATLLRQSGIFQAKNFDAYARMRLPSEVALQLLDVHRENPLSFYWKGLIGFMVVASYFSGGTYTGKIAGVGEFSASIPSLADGVGRMRDIWTGKPLPDLPTTRPSSGENAEPKEPMIKGRIPAGSGTPKSIPGSSPRSRKLPKT